MVRVGRLWAFLALGIAAGCVAAACDPKTTTRDDNSETHFLATCEGEGACSGGLECICGVCTRPCNDDAGCDALSEDASCSDSCDTATATKICDVSCLADPDCDALGADFGCYGGRCRTQADPSASGASGAGGASDGSDTGGAAGQSARSGAAGSPATPSACQTKADPTPELLPNTELDLDVLARAAVVVGSCVGDGGSDRAVRDMLVANSSFKRLWQMNVTQAQCLADATCGCDAMTECLGYRVSEMPLSECEGGCSDGVITACGGVTTDLAEGLTLTLDCNKVGLACGGDKSCAAPDAEACDGSVSRKCENGKPFECQGGKWSAGPDCASLGLVCDGGECVGTGAACDGDSVFGEVAYVGVSCEDGVLEACAGGTFRGKLASFDCAEQGPDFTCQNAMGTPFCGLASECVPARPGMPSPTHPPSCDGTVVTFCNAGRLEHIDCTSLGFTSCEKNPANNVWGCMPTLPLHEL